jgi:uncharacterized RDD family membrane protein YckC
MNQERSDLQSNQPTTDSETVYCSLPRRLMVMLYDAVILLGLLIVASAVALPFGNIEKTALHDFWFTLWLLAACFAYLGGCWRYGGMTLGMRAWRVRLESYEGQNISWPGCLIRFLVGLVSLGTAGLGLLWALIDSKNRTWHDLAAHSLLVKTRKNR